MSQAGNANAPVVSAPTSWEAFKALLEQQWGAIENWGEKEYQALFATAGAIIQTFTADAIAFVKSTTESFVEDIASGNMTFPDAATAVLNAAESKGLTFLEGVGTNALISLIATFVAQL